MTVVEVPKKWDHEADVIVVGGGTAGLPAAITVAEAGLKATILESRPACGGSFNMVAGVFAIAGSEEQKELGIDDSPDLFCQDLVNICGVAPELARAYADNQLDAYRMLKEEGIKFPGLAPHPGHSRNRGLGWIAGLGPKFVKALENGVKNRGVEILLRHRATRLITEPQTGRVIGLKVSLKDEIKNFKAKRAVILATGGFGRNREMIAEYAPEMFDAIPMMPVGHLGDGLKMGLAVGAATKDIGIAVAPAWPVCIETHSNALWVLYWGAIMVSAGGKRFHNESLSEAFYGPLTGAGMRQPGGYWIVYDSKVKENVGKDCEEHLTSIEKCKQYKANTVEELAKSAGIAAKGLRETIDKYNSDIDSVGYDTVFGRKFQLGLERPVVKIDTPPFYAIKCVTSMTSMKGGLKINAHAQVLNQYDEVIPGLYAAGEVTGGLHTKTYLLGTMTSGSMTFGIIAGRNAAKEPAWQ